MMRFVWLVGVVAAIGIPRTLKTNPVSHSAQLTHTAPFSLGHIAPGVANAIQVKVPSGVRDASMLNNFVVNSNGNLVFSGTTPAKVNLKGLISIADIVPKGTGPLGLDSGVKITVTFRTQVGNQYGNDVNITLSAYYPVFEQQLAYATKTLDQFTINQNDEVKMWMFYDLLPPVPSFLPSDFDITFGKCGLSFTVLSNVEDERHPAAMSVLEANANNMNITIGPNVNHVMHTFVPGLHGPCVIDVRINIASQKAYNLAGGSYPLIVAIDHLVYLAVNGQLVKRQEAYSSSGNNPFLFYGQDTEFPSTLTTRLLVDLHEDDVVSVIYNSQNVIVLDFTNPMGFSFLPAGSLITSFHFTGVTADALYPHAIVKQTVAHDIDVPIGASLTSGALVVPLTDCTIDSDQFQIQNNQLVFTGAQQSFFRINANYFHNFLDLHNSDNDPSFWEFMKLGMAIVLNGAPVNTATTESHLFSNTGGTFTLNDANGAENAFRVFPGDQISLVMWATQAKYLNAPPSFPVNPANMRSPPANSFVRLTGKVVLTVE